MNALKIFSDAQACPDWPSATLFETGSCPNRAFHLIDENPGWMVGYTEVGVRLPFFD